MYGNGGGEGCVCVWVGGGGGVVLGGLELIFFVLEGGGSV